MAEILHFEILRKHGQTHKHTNKQTNTQTDMGITIPRPPPMGGEVNMIWVPGFELFQFHELVGAVRVV